MSPSTELRFVDFFLRWDEDFFFDVEDSAIECELVGIALTAMPVLSAIKLLRAGPDPPGNAGSMCATGRFRPGTRGTSEV